MNGHEIMKAISVRVSPETVRRCSVWASRSGLRLSQYYRAALVLGSLELAKTLGVYRPSDMPDTPTIGVRNLDK